MASNPLRQHFSGVINLTLPLNSNILNWLGCDTFDLFFSTEFFCGLSVMQWLPFKFQVPLMTCEDCGGSGLCSECKGEGFVLKKLSDESAERARLAAKNMATRFTAAYDFLGTLSSF